MSQRAPKLELRLQELSLSAQGAHAPGNCSVMPLRGSRLVCVEFPAIIHNLQRAMEALGGEKAVSKTYADPSRRLELYLRPQDPFCHSLCGNRLDSSNLLLRVRRRVRKSDPSDVQVHTELVGIIGTTYKFQGMADFQCLAVGSQNGSKLSLYDKIVLTQPESQDFFNQPLPYFLPPAIFSRLDTPVDYFYRADVMRKASNPEAALHKNFIGLNRARRPHNAIFVNFLDPAPDKPLEMAITNWQRVCVKEMDRRAEQLIKEMFERRPIWSRNAVKANLDIHPEKLKLLLPLVAYYMVTGPWRSLWVRLGYDPRKSSESKQYQMLDFRIRCSTKHGYAMGGDLVKPKRSSLNYTLPNTFNKAVPQAASVLSLQEEESQDQNPSYILKESSYIFREGMVPPHRQMFYQLCDLQVDSLQRVVNANNGLEKLCDERDGWCPIGTQDQLRNIISDSIKKVVKSKKTIRKPQKRRRISLSNKVPEYYEEEEEELEEEEEELGEEEEEPDGALNDTKDEEVDFQPSEGSENEMETEMLEYMHTEAKEQTP
ncbi:unnamed protein product [Knipowitschia caucasica]|uniref:General transcription factor IIIC subunit 5 n=1 Tax=Knipowitschia caucasica TaxID=637954 RepID=A0AAV2J1A6_KNICA